MYKKFQIKQGKDITKLEVDLINKARSLEFNSTSLINPKPVNEDWEKKYFLLKDQNAKTLAFAMLLEIEVEFKRVRHSILGLSNLIAINKGKGYGKILIFKMKKYIKKSGLTCIGFCNKKITGFYKKCGFGVIVDGCSKTLYKDIKGNFQSDRFGGGDLIYIKGGDGLVRQILDNPKENLIIFRPHW